MSLLKYMCGFILRGMLAKRRHRHCKSLKNIDCFINTYCKKVVSSFGGGCFFEALQFLKFTSSCCFCLFFNLFALFCCKLMFTLLLCVVFFLLTCSAFCCFIYLFTCPAICCFFYSFTVLLYVAFFTCSLFYYMFFYLLLLY